jgi:hypothetical protein
MYSHYSRFPKRRLRTIIPGAIVLAIAVYGVLMAVANKPQAIVHSAGSSSYSNQGRFVGSDGWELFPTTSEATAMFDDQLQRAQHYTNFSPCFDEKGQRIGEKVTIWTLSTPPTKGLWRIMWTERNTSSSKLYWVEGESVERVLALEDEAQAKWKLCNATK